MAKTILQPLVFLAITVVTFLVCYLLAITVSVGTIESDGLSLIMVAMALSFAIHWILFIPSYIFQTEKFYELTGTLRPKIFIDLWLYYDLDNKTWWIFILACSEGWP